MGAVHSAKRAHGEIRRRSPIQPLRPSADDPPLRQSVLPERQILATLSHPNIARFLDAGHREDGKPYLVMAAYSKEGLSMSAPDGRDACMYVSLFLRVCAALH